MTSPATKSPTSELAQVAASQGRETDRAPRRLGGSVAGTTLVVGTAVLVPIVFSAYWVSVFTTTVIYAIAAAGIGLLYGRSGLVSLGQVALLGVGAWITLRLGHATSLPFLVLAFIAAVGTGIIGVLVGLPALRLSGLNLAIVTLMLAAAFEIMFNATGFPNGGGGFLGRNGGNETPLQRPALAVSDTAYFRYSVIVAGLMFLVMALHLRGRPGRAWAAIRQSEAGAMASGVDVTRYKLWSFALASATTGVAGALLAGNTGLLNPISFEALQSILLFAVVLIGGAFALGGAVIAALLSQALPALLDELGINGNLILMVFGAGLIHALTTAPAGVAGQLQDAWNGLRRRREGAGDDPA